MIDPREAAAAFGFDETTLVPFTAGHINASWIATAGGARYLLQRVNDHVFPRPVQVMANVAAVTAYASARDARALRLVPTRDGDAWYEGGGVWRAFPFVEGATSPSAATAETAYAAAHAFGAFQRLLGGYDGPPLHETIPGFHDTPLRLAALEVAAADDAHGRVAGARAELEAILRRRGLAHALRDAHVRGDAPERVVHNDAKLANVLLDDRTGAAVCVVDLDTVMPGLSLYDFGDLARSAASDAAEDEVDLARIVVRPEVIDALSVGFLDGAGELLTRTERGLLMTAAQVITLEQAARFLTDWLDGDRYYRVSPERPAHNLERARAQLALLEGLESRR